jgi:hypothetical protein
MKIWTHPSVHFRFPFPFPFRIRISETSPFPVCSLQFAVPSSQFKFSPRSPSSHCRAVRMHIRAACGLFCAVAVAVVCLFVFVFVYVCLLFVCLSVFVFCSFVC